MKPPAKNKFGGLGLTSNLKPPTELREAPKGEPETPKPLKVEQKDTEIKPTPEPKPEIEQEATTPKPTSKKDKSKPVREKRLIVRISEDDHHFMKMKALKERTTIQDIVEGLLIKNKYIKGTLRTDSKSSAKKS